MNGSALGFRFRSLIFWIVCLLGFTAPWDLVLHLDGTGPNSHVWGQLAVMLSRGGAMSISAAFNLVLVVGIACALLGAGMRSWGSAYLGVEVMSDAKLRADGVVVSGPYAYVRNPLYLGGWLNTLALAMLMPVSGAVFTLVVMTGLQWFTILREEAFLRGQLGEAYEAYCARVPRMWPSLRRLRSEESDPTHAMGPHEWGTHVQPRWGQALLAEIFVWGVAVSFAVFGWWYDSRVLIQCVVVSLGVSLVVKGLVKPREKA